MNLDLLVVNLVVFFAVFGFYFFLWLALTCMRPIVLYRLISSIYSFTRIRKQRLYVFGTEVSMDPEHTAFCRRRQTPLRCASEAWCCCGCECYSTVQANLKLLLLTDLFMCVWLFFSTSILLVTITRGCPSDMHCYGIVSTWHELDNPQEFNCTLQHSDTVFAKSCYKWVIPTGEVLLASISTSAVLLRLVLGALVSRIAVCVHKSLRPDFYELVCVWVGRFCLWFLLSILAVFAVIESVLNFISVAALATNLIGIGRLHYALRMHSLSTRVCTSVTEAKSVDGTPPLLSASNSKENVSNPSAL